MSSTTLQISSKLESFLQGTKKLYINGQFVTSHDNKTFATPNPATGETLIDVYEAGEKDIDEAVKAAKKPSMVLGAQCLPLNAPASCSSLLI